MSSAPAISIVEDIQAALAQLKFGRCPCSLTASLAVLPSMSLASRFAPFAEIAQDLKNDRASIGRCHKYSCRINRGTHDSLKGERLRNHHENEHHRPDQSSSIRARHHLGRHRWTADLGRDLQTNHRSTRPTGHDWRNQSGSTRTWDRL